MLIRERPARHRADEGERRRRHDPRRHRRQHPDRQPPPVPLRLGERPDPALELGQRQAGVPLEQPTGLGQPQPPPDPVEQRDPEPILEIAQRLGDRGLRDRQRVGAPPTLDSRATSRKQRTWR